MFIISGNKGVGKTRTLIERAKAEDGIIVCSDVKAMRERAYSYGITGLNLVSYDDLWNDEVDTQGKPMYIHDINKFIHSSFADVNGFTINLD